MNATQEAVMEAVPMITDIYEGYHIAVWPCITIPPHKPFYANATLDRAGKLVGFCGIGGDTPEAAMQNAKRVIDEHDIGAGGRIEHDAREWARETAEKFPEVKPFTGMGEGM